MKLLATGANGQVARALVEAAAKRSIDLLALGRPELDLTQPITVEQAVEKIAPDFVINTAAFTAVDLAEKESEVAFAVNGYGAGVLATICNQRKLPIIHLSTDYVFDGSKKRPYTEIDETSPLGIYGHSKLDGEKAVIAKNARHIILRTAWIYSPFGDNFVKTMLRLSDSQSILKVIDDQRGCPTYAPHVAEGILEITSKLYNIDKSESPWGIYNIAGLGETTWYWFAREIFAQSEKNSGPTAQVQAITTEQYPTPASRPANSRLNCTKLEQVFGITLPNWREGTADCVSRLLNKSI